MGLPEPMTTRVRFDIVKRRGASQISSGSDSKPLAARPNLALIEAVEKGLNWRNRPLSGPSSNLRRRSASITITLPGFRAWAFWPRT
jgi:hypothetical protein